MAKFLSMLMFVFTVVSFMSHTIFSQEYDNSLGYIELPSEANPPTVDYRLKYTDKEFNFLQDCRQKLEDSDCNFEISTDMYDESTTPLTIECCRYLLKFGRDCHLIVANFTSIPMYGFRSPSNAVEKSKYTWKDCVRRIESNIGAPQQSQEFDQYSPEVPDDVSISPTPYFDIHDLYDPPSEADSPSVEYISKQVIYYTDKEFNFLQGCLQKLDDSDCNSEISTDLNDETTTPLTIECCRDLLKIGRDCHLVVANFTSVYMYGYPSTSNAVAKSKYTWKDCVRRIESHVSAPISLE